MVAEAKAVLWDMDGVIVDSAVYHMRSWQETFRAIGITFTDADFRHGFGQRNEEIIHRVLEKDFTAEKFDWIVNAKETSFRRLLNGNVKALPGVMALLELAAKDGWRQALVTSTPPENIDLILGTLGITRCFGTIVSGCDVTEGKPSPQGYLMAACRLGVAPSHCIVIEDAVAGVQAAKNGWMKCIAVTTTHAADKLQAADLIVDSLEKITAGTLNKLIGIESKTRIKKLKALKE